MNGVFLAQSKKRNGPERHQKEQVGNVVNNLPIKTHITAR